MRSICAFCALCLALTPAARAEVAVETWAVGKQATHPGSVAVEARPAGGWLIRVDLKALPAGATIHSARLLLGRDAIAGSDEAARTGGEVFGVAAAGKPEPKPLAVPPPWFDHFDAAPTLRRQLANGRAEARLLVRSFPKWRQADTRLQVRFDGKPGAAAAVRDVKAVHHAGQTFITWREIDDPFGDRAVTWGELRDRLAQLDEKRRVRYRVYRHTAPIDKDTLAAAALLAEVKPLSGFNVNSWSKERLINQTVFGNADKGELANYNPFGGWDRDSAQGGRLVIPRFVIPGGDKPMPPGTGLYVHSAAKAAKAWYAVVASIDGTAGACGAGRGGAVVERPAVWQPVLQSAGKREFGFDFPGEKRFYVTWVAPPLSNVPRYFNWSVHLPPDTTAPAPLNVSFHDLGFSYAKPIRRYDRAAVQIAGHDFDPVSGWYGYHECLGTVRGWGDGKVQPYTERRVLAFMEWAEKTWRIDPTRRFTDGRGMGGLGAIHFACKHPDLFAYVLNDQGAVCCRQANCLPALEDAWGRVDWGLANDQGVNVWDWQDLTWYVRRRGPGGDLPVLAVSPWGHTAWQETYPRKTVGDRRKRWMRNHHTYTAFFKTVLDARHMLFTEFDWGATLAILPDWMDLRRGPVPVVTHSSDRKVKDSPEGPYIFFEPSGSSPGGWIHWHHRWRSADAVDRPDRLEVTLYVTGRGGIVTADVTPRRAARFRPKPGEKFRWSNIHLAEGNRKEWALRNVWKKYPDKAEIQNGIVTADEHGLLTLHKVTILPTKCRVVIERQEDKP